MTAQQCVAFILIMGAFIGVTAFGVWLMAPPPLRDTLDGFSYRPFRWLPKRRTETEVPHG